MKEALDFVFDAEQQAVVVACSDFLQQRVQWRGISFKGDMSLLLLLLLLLLMLLLLLLLLS